MRWPWTSETDIHKRSDSSWSWKRFTEPQTILASLVLAGGLLTSVRVYKEYLRRIPNSKYIKPGWLRQKSLFGTVTRVGDADGFHLYHTPGGRLAGWGWFPGRSIPVNRKELVGQTISVRIAGVDAPELAHFGQEGQPYAKEAHQFLIGLIDGRRVRVYLHSRDQYDRVVATTYVRPWVLKKDVGLEMLKRGLATVYEAKTGAEYGGKKELYETTEQKAKDSKVGMWEKPNLLSRLVGTKEFRTESPREYKNRHKEEAVKK
ncbi:SNase-domain-containing protein [Pseudovirgaria hyperparasitica]|uniref:Probable endonuclease LCL3 n=1 Tax=Pseudovirgaria hyperparasitica TaxID=470096 RepID=A0A6A6W186_9PEZI|nr:SNase-domain-containing protein [Pseudovirgaria hyperparasitica]KAF2756672.1 SNase-domain-containing protein [Pseudovirgaria hyperparasitica]